MSPLLRRLLQDGRFENLKTLQGGTTAGVTAAAAEVQQGIIAQQSDHEEAKAWHCPFK